MVGQLKRALTARLRAGVGGAAMAAAFTASPAFAQCSPELDLQSGTSGAPLNVDCAGTETDIQGDGSNQFVSITVNGTIAPSSTIGIFLGSNNTVLVNGSVTGDVPIYFANGLTDLANNRVTVSSSGSVAGTSSVHGINFFAGGFSATQNSVSVQGQVRGLQLSNFGSTVQNAVTVGTTGRIYNPTGGFSAVTIAGTNGVRGNTVDVSGRIDATDATTSVPRGIDIINSGSGAFQDNRVTVAIGGSVAAASDAVRVLSEDFNNEGPIIPAAEVFRNTVTIAGSATSRQGHAVSVTSVSGVRENTINVTGSVAASAVSRAGIAIEGGGVRGNTVTVSGSGASVTTGGNGVLLRNNGSAAFSGNVVTIGAGATVASGFGGILLSSDAITGPSAQPAATIASNQITVAGAVTSTNFEAISIFSSADARDNIITVSGLARSVANGNAIQIYAVGSAANNQIIIATGGRVQVDNPANFPAIQIASVRSGLATGNVVDNSGSIVGSIDFRAGSGNRLINRAGASITSDVSFNDGGAPSLGAGNELVLFAGSTFNVNVEGGGGATLTLQGPGSGAVQLQRYLRMGPLNVAGGRWTATGAGAAFSSVSIASGAELILNGSLLRSLTVAPGGVLSGVGTTGALTVNGTLAPGNSIGVTNVVGPLGFSPSSIYAVEVGSCSGAPCADRTIATGPVTINGGTVALSVFGTPGPIAGRVPIVTGASVTGAFSTLSVPAGVFSLAFLEYTPNDVFLNFSLGPTVTGAGYGATSLAGAYGVTLLTRSLLSSSDEDNLGRLPGSSGCALYVFSDGAPSRRVEGAHDDGERTVTRAWARGLGAKGSIDGHGAALPGTNYHLTGFATGVERAGGGLSIGAGIGMLNSKMKAGGHLLDIETAHLMAYGGYESGPFSIGLALAAGRHAVDSSRAVLAGDVARAAYHGWTYGAAIEAGYGFKSGEIEMTPYVGLDYTRTTFAAFTEAGASFGNLAAPKRAGDVLRTTIGARFTTENLIFGKLKPGVRAAYAREFLTDDEFSASFVGAPSSGFTVESAALGRDRALVGAGVAMRLGKSGTLSLSYDGEFSASDRVHGGAARVTFAF